nr:hypothetical protein L203_00414 [Cryptococcus depauperatus CBS 7841]
MIQLATVETEAIFPSTAVLLGSDMSDFGNGSDGWVGLKGRQSNVCQVQTFPFGGSNNGGQSEGLSTKVLAGWWACYLLQLDGNCSSFNGFVVSKISGGEIFVSKMGQYMTVVVNKELSSATLGVNWEKRWYTSTVRQLDKASGTPQGWAGYKKTGYEDLIDDFQAAESKKVAEDGGRVDKNAQDENIPYLPPLFLLPFAASPDNSLIKPELLAYQLSLSKIMT